MLQQGQGVMTPSAEDIVCGAHRSVNETIASHKPKLDVPQLPAAPQPAAAGVQPSNSRALSTTGLLPPGQPSQPVLHSEDAIREAFRQAELEQRQFESAGGHTPSPRHDGEPKLDPTVPPIPGMSSDAGGDSGAFVLQRPASSSRTNAAAELPIRRLGHNVLRTDMTTGEQKSARIVSGSSGADEEAHEAPGDATAPTPTLASDTTRSTANSAHASAATSATTVDIANVPGRIYPLPVPFLPEKPPRRMQPAISLGSQTLPPSIVIAPRSEVSTVPPTNQVTLAEEPTAAKPPNVTRTHTAHSAHTTHTTHTPAPTMRADAKRKNDVFDIEELHERTDSSGPDAASSLDGSGIVDKPLLRGDRNLPTLLIIICLSTVAVVLVAVVVGVCFVHRRRGNMPFIGSSSSSASTRSNVFYGTSPNAVVHTHPTQQYLSQTQFSAVQMGTLQRSR